MPDARRPDAQDDFGDERAFERRFGPRLRERPDPDGRYREHRSWLSRAGDEVSAWFGDPKALHRRQIDEASGDHRGKGPKAERRADDRILEEVSDEMSAHPDLDASHIELRVQDCEVSLTGWVSISADKRLAEDIAANVPGVAKVRNGLRIGEGPEGV